LIKELAAQVGFTDANNFLTLFKRFHGLSPEAYRARHRSSPSQSMPPFPPGCLKFKGNLSVFQRCFWLTASGKCDRGRNTSRVPKLRPRPPTKPEGGSSSIYLLGCGLRRLGRTRPCAWHPRRSLPTGRRPTSTPWPVASWPPMISPRFVHLGPTQLIIVPTTPCRGTLLFTRVWSRNH
jgi:hypothetical protein